MHVAVQPEQWESLKAKMGEIDAAITKMDS
jgi:hypothetical protein